MSIFNSAILLRETQESRVQLEGMLRQAEGQQQQLDSQLVDMESHRAKALAATAKGNSVLQHAESTLNTLKVKRKLFFILES